MMCATSSARVRRDAPVALDWMVCIERDARAPGRQHAEDRGRIARFIGEESRDRAGAAAGSAHGVCDAIRLGREFAVGEAARAVTDRKSLRMATRDRCKPRDDRGLEQRRRQWYKRPLRCVVLIDGPALSCPRHCRLSP